MSDNLITENSIFTEDGGNNPNSYNQPIKMYRALISNNLPWTDTLSGQEEVGQILLLDSYKGGIVATTSNLVGGTGYLGPATLGVTGGTGTGLTVNITESGGVVTSITLVNQGEGYTVGDVLTINSGNQNATFTVDTIYSDDFSNWTLISGTENTDGAEYLVTNLNVVTWDNGSTLIYDGRPYIVSRDSNGNLGPLVNNFNGTISLYGNSGIFSISSYDSEFASFKTIAFLERPQNSITYYSTIFPPGTGGSDASVIYFETRDSGGTLDNILRCTELRIEVYP